MGLNFRQRGAGVSFRASWSYGGFKRFRCRLFNAAGYEGDLYDMYTEGIFPEKLPDDPLWPFFNHSDCDGELSVEEMKRIEPRMRDLISQWENPEDGYDKENGLALCKAMRECIADNEVLIFT